MYNSKLISVFLGLNGTEKRAINKFVSSPFFNKRSEVSDLWRYLISSAKEGAPAYQKERIFKSVFPGQAYNDKKMRHVSSWLLQCIEQYLALASYWRTPIIGTLHQARVYNQKKLVKHFQQTIKTGQSQLEDMPRGPEFFYYNYLLEFEQYSFVGSRSRINENNLRQMSTALDKHLFMSKLKQACIMLSHRSVFTTEYDFKLVNLLLEFLNESEYLQEPGIACYYYCYRALSENNEACFRSFRDTLHEHQHQLPTEDVGPLYFFAINFCIRKLNTGDVAYRRETFELYRSGLSEGILITNGELSRFAYNNIVSTGLPLGEFDWLEQFIHQYKEAIDPKFRATNFTYNLAKLHFTKKDYEEAMRLLIQISERDLLLNLDAKVMLIRIYYEQDEFTALTSLLSSFNVMLDRKKVLSYHKTHYKNIIRFTNRLLHLKPSDQKAYEKLKNDINQASVLGLKDWFLEQLG